MSAQPNVDLPAAPGAHRLYVPGYAGWKLALCACGIVLWGVGLFELWPPLRLVLFGRHAQAIAKCVVKTKPGQSDLVLLDDAQVQAHLETRDNTYTFWNVFSFDTGDGRTVDVRDNVGSRLKPLYPLVDSEGLRTTATVCYDVGKPQAAVFPTEMSTWLSAAVLALAGFACTVICAILYYWADKPIELPEVHPAAADGSLPPASATH